LKRGRIMLKRFLCVVFFVLVFPVYVSAGSIDFPYYFGLVTSDGGTTANNGHWVECTEFGHNHPTVGWDGYFRTDEAQAVRLLDNGAIAVLYWYYGIVIDNPEPTPDVMGMILSDADIFKVDQNTLVYYGSYCFDESPNNRLLINPQRARREWKTGESVEITKVTGGISVKENMTLDRKGITLSAHAVPGSTALTDCAFIHYYEYSDSSPEFEYSVRIYAPGKGEVANMNYESEADEIGMDGRDEVSAWGTSVDYPAYMTNDPNMMGNDFTTGLAVLNSLTLDDTNIVDAKVTGNSRVVVIPVN
jgi:hypothetical protein